MTISLPLCLQPLKESERYGPYLCPTRTNFTGSNLKPRPKYTIPSLQALMLCHGESPPSAHHVLPAPTREARAQRKLQCSFHCLMKLRSSCAFERLQGN